MTTDRIIVRRLTPPGRGGVGVILLSGKGASSLLAPFVRRPNGTPLWNNGEKGRLAEDPPRNVPLFGWFHFVPGEPAHEEAIFHLLSDREIEIHCHGGDLIVGKIIKTLIDVGAEEVIDPPPTWEGAGAQDVETTLTTSSPIPDFRGDALLLLPFARTERIAKILLDQMNGEPERFATRLLQGRTFASDKGEEEEKEASSVLDRLARILALAETGRFLVSPPSILLTGPVNAGKSSLLNGLVGFDRVLTDASAGTTRDIVRVETVIEGFPVTLRDTAGIRTDSDPTGGIEKEGIDRALALFDSADLIVTVFDLTAPGDFPEKAFRETLASLGHPFPSPDRKTPPRSLIVLNKNDRPTEEWNPVWREWRSSHPERAVIEVSAFDPESIERLKRRMIEILIPSPPREGEILPLNARQERFFRNLWVTLQKDF